MSQNLAAFAGLGSMGRPMAANIQAKGLLAAVWNRSPGPAEAFSQAHGLPRADDPAHLARQANILVLCVSADEDVLAVVDAMLPVLGRDHVVVDCSTVRPETARRIAQMLSEVGAGFLDAPVSGGTEGAEQGSLSMMIGGRCEDLARARPILEAMAGRLVHMGPAGSGQATKAVNQVAVAGVNQAVADAMALAKSQGLDLDQVIQALSGGAADSWFLQKRAPNMRDGVYPLGFRLSLHDKDLAICQSLTEAMGVRLPIIEMTRLHYRRLIEAGHGDEDVSSLFRLKLEQLEEGEQRGGDDAEQQQ
ncbi:NAD(P)-dependent oxidoreductase [Gammaproteobacteria bacterium AB-CW1]|uniref:NAD(P)-dependent oxidoreductase n=1 Tax=Natronospira elongata TaxID=3110268 RepID=A0AAP6JEA5_9GAMM|nr:NAD(P)-dependent oxidoreductase [Gammaproteobacteria bacterium AB-CW1]